jgi:hypothetical protein
MAGYRSFVAAIGPTQVRKRLSERRNVSLRHAIVFVAPQEHADAPYPFALLRCAPRAAKPLRRRGA